MIDRPEITGVILCGGAARRMGGVDKPRQLLNGTPLVEHVRSRLRPQVSRVIISANRNLDAYAAWGDTVISDDEADVGPLGGLASAMREVKTPYTFCCPGDAPFLDTELVSRLATALEHTSTANDGIGDAALPHDGERQQQLFLLLRTACGPALDEFLAAGNKAVHAFAATLRTVTVDVSDIASSFVNINSVDQLEHLSRAE